MRNDRDAMMVVRAELSDRLDQLRRHADRSAAAEFGRSLEAMRLLARAYGLAPVARLAEALQRAAAEDRPGCCPIALYLERMRDAIGCERLDDEASQAMLASVTVRLGA